MINSCIVVKLPLGLYENDTGISKNKIATSITLLPKQFDISFDFYPTYWNSRYTSIFHMTTGSNCCNPGSRIPAIFQSNGKLQVSFAISGNGNYYFDTPQLTLNKWVTIRISQRLEGTNYVYRVYMDKTLLKRVVNRRAQEYRNVKVFVGDSYYTPQRGYVKNISITDASKSIFIFSFIWYIGREYPSILFLFWHL